jgi:hypothetical protein
MDCEIEKAHTLQKESKSWRWNECHLTVHITVGGDVSPPTPGAEAAAPKSALGRVPPTTDPSESLSLRKCRG